MIWYNFFKFLEVDQRWAKKHPLKRLVDIVFFSEGQNSKLCLGLGLIDPISDQRHAPAFRYFFSCLLLSTPARQSGGGTSCFSTGTSWQRCRVDWSIRARYSRWKLYSPLRRFSPFAQKQQHFREKQKIRPNNDIFIRTHFSSKTMPHECHRSIQTFQSLKTKLDFSNVFKIPAAV